MIFKLLNSRKAEVFFIICLLHLFESGVNCKRGEDLVNVLIHFQSGFQGEDLEIYVNGKSISQKDSLVSSPILGFAGSDSVQIHSGISLFEVYTGKRKVLSKIINVEPNIHLGIYVDKNNRFYLNSSKESFIYY